jgi:hypothetical protein
MTVTFSEDVELLSVEADRVAVDQPPGFWEARNERGAFAVTVLIPAGRAVEIRHEAPEEIVLEWRSAHQMQPTMAVLQPEA